MELRLKKINGTYILERDGTPLHCPIQSRILVPGKLAGSFGVDVAMCSSQCALFKIHHPADGVGGSHVELCQAQHHNVQESIEKASNNGILFQK